MNTYILFNKKNTFVTIISIVFLVGITILPFVSDADVTKHRGSGSCSTPGDNDCDGKVNCSVSGVCKVTNKGVRVYDASRYDLNDKDPSIGGFSPPPVRPF